MNVREKVVYRQPRNEEERAEVAEACVLAMDLEMPMALDRMSNEVDLAYAALPERLYVIDAGGAIRYRSAPGPWGFNLDDWEEALRAQRDSVA